MFQTIPALYLLDYSVHVFEMFFFHVVRVEHLDYSWNHFQVVYAVMGGKIMA